MGKRENFILDDTSLENINVIKKRIGAVSKSQAVRFALNYTAENMPKVPSPAAPVRGSGVTRAAPKPSAKESQYEEFEDAS